MAKGEPPGQHPTSILKKKNTQVTFDNLPDIRQSSLEDPYYGETAEGDDNAEDSFLRSKREAKPRPVSTFSAISALSLDNADPKFRVVASLVVLKILFLDLGTSLADTVTDFLQGLYLMYRWENGTLVAKTDGPGDDSGTYEYGVVVILANWIPGVVAVIHILAFHRQDYLDTKLDDEKKKKEKKKFVTLLLLCFFVYPIIPTIGYIIVLLQMNIAQKSIQGERTEMFARTAHSIAGCIEAPCQLVMTTYLIMRGLLDIPWADIFSVGYHTDRLDNTIITINIPMWSIIFSFLNIMTSAIQINIFNVYIGQFRNLDSLQRYFNLAAGHTPFFFHAIIFRIISISFLMLYLDMWGLIPIFAIFSSNLLIGYINFGHQEFSDEVRESLQSRARSFVRKKKRTQSKVNIHRINTENKNVPIWLNSFLGVFVPSCYLSAVHPYLLAKASPQVQKNVFLKQAEFQKRMIKYQSFVSTLIILIASGVACLLVNMDTSYNYNLNRFANVDFNILCGLILMMGLISFCFLNNIDVLSSLGYNDDPGIQEEITIRISQIETIRDTSGEGGNDEIDGTLVVSYPEDARAEVIRNVAKRRHSHSLLKKLTVVLIILLLTITPLIAAYIASHYFGSPKCYIVSNVERNNSVNVIITKADVLNNFDWSAVRHDDSKVCNDTTKNQFSLQKSQKHILVIDMESDVCRGKLEKPNDLENLNLTALILLASKKKRTSSPFPIPRMASIPAFPVVIVNYLDKNRTITAIGSNPAVGLAKDNFEELLNNDASELYQMECQAFGTNTQEGCLHMFHRTHIFLGCNGNPKNDGNVLVTCLDKGKPCPELERFESNLIHTDPFSDCMIKEGLVNSNSRTGKYPALTCRNGKRNKYDNLGCDSESEQHFWKQPKNVCISDAKNYVFWPQSCPSDVKKDCSDSEWGEWSENPKKCIVDSYKYRFCKIKVDCVLMERATLKGQDCVKEDQFGTDPCSVT